MAGARAGRATWCKANDWRSAIDGIERKIKRGTGYASWKDSCGSPGSLSPLIVLFSPSFFTSQKDQTSSVSSGNLRHLCPTMTFIGMDSAHFYHTPTTTSMRKDGQPPASSLRVSMPGGRATILRLLNRAKNGVGFSKTII